MGTVFNVLENRSVITSSNSFLFELSLHGPRISIHIDHSGSLDEKSWILVTFWGLLSLFNAQRGYFLRLNISQRLVLASRSPSVIYSTASVLLGSRPTGSNGRCTGCAPLVRATKEFGRLCYSCIQGGHCHRLTIPAPTWLRLRRTSVQQEPWSWPQSSSSISSGSKLIGGSEGSSMVA